MATLTLKRESAVSELPISPSNDLQSLQATALHATLASGWSGRFKQVRSHPRIVVGATILLVLILVSLFPRLFTHYDPNAISLTAGSLTAPSAAHWLGTDILGRDQLSRLLYGGRLTLVVIAVSTLIGSTIGVGLGVMSGYRRGWLDGVTMRVMDGILSFPGLILALTIAFVLGPSEVTIVIALSVVQVPAFARVARAQTLALKESEFVEAARSMGVRTPRIIWRHLLANMTDVFLIQISIAAGQTVFTMASLSFLGAGIPPPAPSWGGMLHDGYPYLQNAPWESLIPGGAIFVIVLAFNLLSDGFRDVFDPNRVNS
jgi:peptide/nickel transport system permease protein